MTLCTCTPIKKNSAEQVFPFQCQYDITQNSTTLAMFDKDTQVKLQKAQNGGEGVKEATWDVIKKERGREVERQGGVFWILHVDMDMGSVFGVSSYTSYLAYCVTYRWAAL